MCLSRASCVSVVAIVFGVGCYLWRMTPDQDDDHKDDMPQEEPLTIQENERRFRQEESTQEFESREMSKEDCNAKVITSAIVVYGK